MTSFVHGWFADEMVRAVATDLDSSFSNSHGGDATITCTCDLLFAIAVPVALLLHVRFRRTTGRRILFAGCLALSCLPLYFAAMGPLYFLYAGYELRPEREVNGW